MFVYVEDADENMLELMVPFLMIYDDETGEDPSPSFIRTFQEAIMDDLEGNLFFTRLNMVLEMQTLGVLQGGDNDVLEQRKLDGLHSCVETLLLITSVRNIFPLLESWEMLPNVLRISQTLRGRMPVYLYEPIVSFLSYVSLALVRWHELTVLVGNASMRSYILSRRTPSALFQDANHSHLSRGALNKSLSQAVRS